MAALYLLKFCSGKCYVGQTTKTMQARLTQHRNAAKRGSELPVHCAWRKHGEPEAVLLGEFDCADALHAAEIDAIARCGTLAPGGYNVSMGGDTAPSKSPEVAKKIAAKATGRKHSDTSPWVASNTRLWQDPEYRQKVLDGVAASYTAERRAKIGERMREFWAKRKAEGWAPSKESRAKLSGRTISEETRAKMSEAAKRRGAPLKAIAASAEASKGKKRGPYKPDRVAKAAAGVKAAWADPIKRERLMAARKAAGETRRKAQEKELAP